MFHCLNCSHQSETEFKFCPDCGTEASAPTESETLLGKVLNHKYRVVEEVGNGAMGTVYRAEQVSLKKPIAIKVLHEDLMVNDESVRRFQAEGIAAGKFSHPAAIQIFDFDKDESGHWFLAMEFVEGKSLREYLAEKGPISADGAIRLTIQILDALVEAHRQGIVHRDLKPDNIMVVGSASGELHVKVLDFGLSKLVDNAAGSSLMTQTGRILGTPRYMAPEQWQGIEVDHRIDLYAAGLVLYEMVTGESPVSGTSVQDAMAQSQSDAVPSLLDTDLDLEVPAGLDEIVTRALAKDREERYQDAQEMIDDLDEIDFEAKARQRRATGRRGSSGARRAKAAPAGRSPALLYGGIAVALVVVVFVAMQLVGDGNGTVYARVSEKPAEKRSEEEKGYVAELTKARDAMRQRALDMALAAVERAKAMQCADSEVHLVRARIYRAKLDDDAARLACEQAIKSDAKYLAAIAELGWIHFDAGDWAKATTQFDAALAIDTAHAHALVGKASLLMERGSDKDAREEIAAIDVSSQPANVAVRLGSLYLGFGDLTEAADAFTSAKLANAFDWRAHAGLGETMLRNDEPDQARKALVEAVRLNPDAVSARTALATLYVDGERWAEAQRLIDEGLSRHSNNGRLHILAGVVQYLGYNQPDQAIPSLESGTSRSPRDYRAWTLLGVLYQQKGRHQDAIGCYEKAQAIDRSQPQPFLNHGLCLMALEKHAEAEPLLKRATELGKDNAYTFLAYGILLRDYLGKNAAALTAFQTHKALGGEDPRVDGWIKALGGK